MLFFAIQSWPFLGDMFFLNVYMVENNNPSLPTMKVIEEEFNRL